MIFWPKISPLFFLLISLQSTFAVAAYHDVLPKGVRLFGVKQIYTDKVDGFYGPQNNNQNYDFNLNIDANVLSKVQELDEYMLKNIKKQNPNAYKELSAGVWNLDVKAKAKVHGFGLAYGITNSLMVTVSIPYYIINVFMSATRTGKNNYKQTNIKLNETGDPSGIHFDLSNLPDPNGSFLQNVLVNGYNYKPIGDWEGRGFGDLNIELKKRIRNGVKGGDAISMGISSPTGRTESPDILQDISLGKGYWTFFTEYGGSYSLNNYLSLESFIRGTIASVAVERKRVARDYDFPLASEEANFIHKPGEKIDYSFLAGIKMNDWFKFSPQYLYSTTKKSKYESPHQLANKIYAANTQVNTHKIRLSLEFSSITPFLKKVFALPFTFILSGEKIIKAKNTPNIQMISLDSRILF